MVRKLHQINESVDGYEPEGREFESLRAPILQGFQRLTSKNSPAVSPVCYPKVTFTAGAAAALRPPLKQGGVSSVAWCNHSSSRSGVAVEILTGVGRFRLLR